MRPLLERDFKASFSTTQAPIEGPFGESWRPLLSLILGHARRSGADFAEVFLERRNTLRVTTENGKVTAVAPAFSLGAGVRCFKGTQDVYVSTNDLSREGLRWAVDQALAMLGLSTRMKHSIGRDVQLEPLRDFASFKGKNSWLAACAGVTEMSGRLLEQSAALKKKVAHLQSDQVSAFRDWQEVLVAASDGVFARDIRLHQLSRLGVNCADGADRASAHEQRASTGQPDFLKTVDMSPVVSELADSVGVMLRADYVSAGQYPLVMANRFGGVIFHEACGHLLETTQIERKTTPFADSLGQPIAHESLSAWDEGVTEGAFGSTDMDDEGMPAQSTLLIENGILRNFIADRAGSMRFGHPRTGSGRRQNFTFAAASRMRNTFIAPGKFTPEELISSCESGLYCKKMGGGSVGATGEFNFAVAEAYLIEKGKLGKPVKGATLIGTAVDIMKKISACANDIELAPGFCGSVSGTIYTTVGQPHLKVDNITVGGRA
ncbi:TldD/PmbA family protein [bacterium]|nr:TldD/PmbA family protein [bacterium]